MTTFNLVNAGQTFHHMIVARLDSGKTITDLNAALASHGPPPAWLVMIGGPNAPDPQGGEANATMDLRPGNYVMICMVDTPDRVPHVAKGMMHAFTVIDPGSSAPAPKADVTIVLADYRFDISAPVTAGKRTFEVRTDAPQAHEIELIKLAPGKTQNDLLQWMEKMEGPPPGSAIGGIAPLVPGRTAYFTADMEPGEYVLVCFLPNPTDPTRMHFMDGMIQTIKVL
jgi:hypothetical protein